MKIAAVMGTYRKTGAGEAVIRQIEQALKDAPGVEIDRIWLGDTDLRLCRGCRVCYERGEAACPLKDGYLDAMARLNGADAAIFYSPVYTLSVSGMMKTFFDRSSWVLHRPHFKGRYALVLTTVASWGERPALSTLGKIVSMMGFSAVASLGVVTAKAQSNPGYRRRMEKRVARAARLLVKRAASSRPVRPSLIELITFRVQKSVFGTGSPGCANDKAVWRAAGWADKKAVYYCPARVSPVRRAAADAIAWFLLKLGLFTA